jgi:hypothetical protein
MRRVATVIAALLLFLPASATIPTAQWNLQQAHRLRDLHRVPPDTGFDQYVRLLRPFLPREGPVGFHDVGVPDDGRLYFRVQYALVPRTLLRTAHAEFVVESGPAAAEQSLLRDPRFSLVTSPGDDLRLFKRIRP